MQAIDTLNKVFNLALIISFTLVLVCVTLSFYLISVEESKTEIVAQTISAEACSEGFLVMVGVGNTIKNRMDKKGLSAYDVVTELNQYYGFTHPNREKIFSNPQCSAGARFIAQHLTEIPDVTDGAIFFKTVYEKLQPWHTEKTITIKQMEFFK
jgi:spore germination cell wall hydrolase CwlJ-like protein